MIDEKGFEYSDDLTILKSCPKTFNGDFVIPDTVTEIGWHAFEGCTSLTSIIIPNSVITIRDFAFSDCSYLTFVTIGNSVTTIGRYAFNGCSSLTSITIPNSVFNIGEGAFCRCSSLTSIIVDNKNSFFDSRDNCNAIIKTALNKLIAGCKHSFIPNSVTTIGDYAFAYCNGLTSVTIPNSVTTIGKEAFAGCSGLTKTNYTGTIADWCKISFELSNDDCYHNPIEYSNNFFINNVEVKDLIIPEGVESISDAAFCGCHGLTSVTIPNSVTKIGRKAFEGCFNLTSVTIGSSVVEIGWSAFGCCGLTKINYTGTIAQWCQITFQDYESNPMFNSHNFFINDIEVKDLVIPEETNTIKSFAFENCSSLTSVIIPNSVTSIGEHTFDGCEGLTSVTIPNSVTKIGYDAFRFCSSLTKIVVPIGQKERFSKMDGLADFRNKLIEQAQKIDDSSQILFNLAKAYEMGVGVKQDEEQAYMFYKQAAEAGSQEAQQWIQQRCGLL